MSWQCFNLRWKYPEQEDNYIRYHSYLQGNVSGFFLWYHLLVLVILINDTMRPIPKPNNIFLPKTTSSLSLLHKICLLHIYEVMDQVQDMAPEKGQVFISALVGWSHLIKGFTQNHCQAHKGFIKCVYYILIHKVLDQVQVITMCSDIACAG